MDKKIRITLAGLLAVACFAFVGCDSENNDAIVGQIYDDVGELDIDRDRMLARDTSASRTDAGKTLRYAQSQHPGQVVEPVLEDGVISAPRIVADASSIASHQLQPRLDYSYNRPAPAPAPAPQYWNPVKARDHGHNVGEMDLEY